MVRLGLIYHSGFRRDTQGLFMSNRQNLHNKRKTNKKINKITNITQKISLVG